MVAKGTAHEVCITKLIRELIFLVGNKATIRVQSPIISLSDSKPEPDFTIAVNRYDDYLSNLPIAADILLLI